MYERESTKYKLGTEANYAWWEGYSAGGLTALHEVRTIFENNPGWSKDGVLAEIEDQLTWLFTDK